MVALCSDSMEKFFITKLFVSPPCMITSSPACTVVGSPSNIKFKPSKIVSSPSVKEKLIILPGFTGVFPTLRKPHQLTFA